MQPKGSLAMGWAYEKFDCYLIERNFGIETVYRPLVPFMGEKFLSTFPVRVPRFRLRLMRYDYAIFHTLVRICI